MKLLVSLLSKFEDKPETNINGYNTFKTEIKNIKKKVYMLEDNQELRLDNIDKTEEKYYYFVLTIEKDEKTIEKLKAFCQNILEINPNWINEIILKKSNCYVLRNKQGKVH